MIATVVKINISDCLTVSRICSHTSINKFENLSQASGLTVVNIYNPPPKPCLFMLTYLRCLYTSHILIFVSIPPLNKRWADFGNHLIQAIPCVWPFQEWIWRLGMKHLTGGAPSTKNKCHWIGLIILVL